MDKETPRKTAINNTIIDKQYLAYYLYRIWIKQRKLMELVNSNAEFDEILNYLEIPAQYQELNLVYPMVNKMTINEKQLDLVILSILRHMNNTVKQYAKDPKPPADFKLLQDYTNGKTIENIIQDIIQIKLLVPNLSRPANVLNIWDDLDDLFESFDMVEITEDKKILNSMNAAKNVSQISNKPSSINLPASTNVSKSASMPPSMNQPIASQSISKPASMNQPIASQSTSMPPSMNQPASTNVRQSVNIPASQVTSIAAPSVNQPPSQSLNKPVQSVAPSTNKPAPPPTATSEDIDNDDLLDDLD